MWARLAGGTVFQAILFTTLLIGPVWLIGEDWRWPRGWLLVAILVSASTLGSAYFAITDPTLFNERSKAPVPKTRKDGFATALIAIAVIGWFTAAPLDVFRWRLLEKPVPTFSLWGGLAIFVAGVAVIGWTLRVNSFAASVVKVQEAQSVIDTGPYAYVRHPMYAGALLYFTGAALIVESSALALLSIPVFAFVFLPRMVVEEDTLWRDLPGYDAYYARVKARLIPGIL